MDLNITSVRRTLISTSTTAYLYQSHWIKRMSVFLPTYAVQQVPLQKALLFGQQKKSLYLSNAIGRSAAARSSEREMH